MPDAFWHWLGYAVALASLGVLVWALLWDRARGRRRCRQCWYDLSDVVERLGEPTGESPITCPECGRAHTKPKQLRRTRRRWRWAAAALLAMSLGGYGLWAVPRVQDRGWVGAVPTWSLIALSPWLEPPPMAISPQIGAISMTLSDAGAANQSVAQQLASELMQRPLSGAVYGTVPAAWLITSYADLVASRGDPRAPLFDRIGPLGIPYTEALGIRLAAGHPLPEPLWDELVSRVFVRQQDASEYRSVTIAPPGWLASRTGGVLRFELFCEAGERSFPVKFDLVPRGGVISNSWMSHLMIYNTSIHMRIGDDPRGCDRVIGRWTLIVNQPDRTMPIVSSRERVLWEQSAPAIETGL